MPRKGKLSSWSQDESTSPFWWNFSLCLFATTVSLSNYSFKYPNIIVFTLQLWEINWWVAREHYSKNRLSLRVL